MSADRAPKRNFVTRTLDHYRLREYRFDETIEWNWHAVPFNRVALVNALVSRTPNCAYLEIGCADNSLFSALPIADKTGVDPVEGGTLRMTSDAFFAQNKRKFDVVFIDGLHTYEQVRTDAINAMASLNDGGWIAFHDMLPSTWRDQHVPRLKDRWTGDVWKVAFELAATDGIDFRIVLIDHGCGVLRVSGKAPQLADMRARLTAAKFDYFYANHRMLPLSDWNDAFAWIDACEPRLGSRMPGSGDSRLQGAAS